MKSIDRFEGDIAIIDDDGKLYGMRRDMLPSDAAEGDIIAARQYYNTKRSHRCLAAFFKAAVKAAER